MQWPALQVAPKCAGIGKIVVAQSTSAQGAVNSPSASRFTAVTSQSLGGLLPPQHWAAVTTQSMGGRIPTPYL
jgi:hypothetical protein